MRRGKTVLLILLFVALSLARQLLPEQRLLVRERLTQTVERGSDYGALAAALGRGLRAEKPEEGLIAAFGLHGEVEPEQPSPTPLPEMEPMPGESL